MEESLVSLPSREHFWLRLKVASMFRYCGLPTEYVPKECYDHVRNYKYCGSDMSPLYKHVLKPIAQYMVESTPATLAPNNITLLGFGFTSFALTVGLVHVTALDNPEAVPAWYALLCAVCLFSYQTLDNMDGIQARKTGSSSPLGQLFDHGIDAMNATVLILIMGINSGNEAGVIYVCMIQTMMTFFCTTWEEYATGSFTLGFVNGPDDGLTLCYILLACSAFYGPIDFWQLELPLLDMTLQRAMIPILVSAGVATVALQLWMTYRSHRQGFFKAFPALVSLAVYLALFAVASFRLSASEWTKAASMCLAGGSLFGLMMCRLILAHVCHQEVHVFQREHLLMVPAVVLPGVGTMLSCFLGIVCVAHYAIVAIDDFCVILNIDAFVLKPTAPPVMGSQAREGSSSCKCCGDDGDVSADNVGATGTFTSAAAAHS